MQARNGQGVECLTEGATFAQRRVFAYDGVGYTREVGAPAPRPYVAPVVEAARERLPILTLAAIGFGAGLIVAALAIVAGLI